MYIHICFCLVKHVIKFAHHKGNKVHPSEDIDDSDDTHLHLHVCNK